MLLLSVAAGLSLDKYREFRRALAVLLFASVRSMKKKKLEKLV